MKQFLRENWLFIVAPIVLLAIGLIVAIKMSQGDNPYVYNP